MSRESTCHSSGLPALPAALAAAIWHLAGSTVETLPCAARAAADPDAKGIRPALLHFLDLDGYLADQAIGLAATEVPIAITVHA
jgi:hypothetical protein